MKVLITNHHKSWKNVKTGKGYFIRRLITEFAKTGIDVTTDPSCEVDIHLGIGKFEHYAKCKKRILRLGDCHKALDENYRLLNKRKIIALNKADGVIYQSKYSQKLCDAFLGEAKCPTIIIFNGANPNEFDVEPYKSPYKYNFLASARVWTKQKRLRYIEEAFWLANIPNSCLWICGDLKKGWERGEHNAITRLGIVDQSILASLYKLCDAMIDITWLSACPNNVVESLVAGCPVISSNDGGIHELGWSYKKHPLWSYECIRSDKIYDFKPINLNKPPKFYMYGLSENIKLRKNLKKPNFTFESLHISNIVQQYKKFFERILICGTSIENFKM